MNARRGVSDRDAIMRAAHRLISGSGGSGASIEKILAEAGVNRRVFYRHFASKDDLLVAMQDWAGDLILGDLRAVVTAASSPSDAVAAWIEDYLRVGWDPIRLRDARTFLAPEVSIAAGIAAAIEVTYARHRAVLAEVLASGVADGSLPNAKPELDSFAIHAAAVRHIEARIRGCLDADFDEVREHLVALFLTALSAGGSN